MAILKLGIFLAWVCYTIGVAFPVAVWICLGQGANHPTTAEAMRSLGDIFQHAISGALSALFNIGTYWVIQTVFGLSLTQTLLTYVGLVTLGHALFAVWLVIKNRKRAAVAPVTQ